MTMPLASVLHVMSDDQLDRLIQRAMQEGFQQGQKKSYEKPLTKKEAAAFLRINPWTMDRRFKTNKLPASLRHVVDGSIYFFASELQEFLKKS